MNDDLKGLVEHHIAELRHSADRGVSMFPGGLRAMANDMECALREYSLKALSRQTGEVTEPDPRGPCGLSAPSSPPAPAEALEAAQLCDTMADSPRTLQHEAYLFRLASRALRAQGGVTECEWYEDGENSMTWATACGNCWTFEEPPHEDKSAKFCMGCGKPIKYATLAAREG